MRWPGEPRSQRSPAGAKRPRTQVRGRGAPVGHSTSSARPLGALWRSCRGKKIGKFFFPAPRPSTTQLPGTPIGLSPASKGLKTAPSRHPRPGARATTEKRGRASTRFPLASRRTRSEAANARIVEQLGFACLSTDAACSTKKNPQIFFGLYSACKSLGTGWPRGRLPLSHLARLLCRSRCVG